MHHIKMGIALGIIMMGWWVATARAYEPGCIEVAPGYQLQKVMTTAMGLPYQTALLPDGSLVVADFNNHRIVHIAERTITPLVAGSDLQAFNVASLPDGRIVYGTRDGRIKVLDIPSGSSQVVGATPNGEWINALATDSTGNIYVVSSKRTLFRVEPTGNFIIASNLPFDDTGSAITDMDVANDGTVYVAGFNRVVAIDRTGRVAVVAEGLNYEPVFVEVAPDDTVYINENTRGLQRYEPVSGRLTSVRIDNFGPFSDILAPSAGELIFYETEAYYKANLTTGSVVPLFTIPGNSYAFAANASDSVFFSTPSHPPVLNSHIVNLRADGNISDLIEFTYPGIWSVDVDSSNRLCMATSEGFRRVEPDGSVTALSPTFPPNYPNRLREIGLGPDGYWNVITTDFNDSIEVYRFRDSGGVEILPIAFNRNSFGNAEAVTEASIDVGNDGRLALIATAVVSWGQGPFYQRVFRANPDGTGLREIANLDSRRTGGPVDIAVGPNDDVFVLVLQPGGVTGDGELIYRIRDNGEISEVVKLCSGNDPKSIDVDPAGNLWFSATNGVYRVPGVAPPPVRYQFESPPSGPVSGIAVVRGWAFDERNGENIAKVELYVDGQRLTDIPCCSERADVRDGFPQYPADNTRNSGWGLTLNWGNLPEGSHAVQVKLESTSGVTAFGDARAVQVVKPGGFAFLDQFDLSQAQASLQEEALVLNGVRVRDKDSRKERDIAARFRWFADSQSFRLVESTNLARASRTGDPWAGLWRLLKQSLPSLLESVPLAQAAPGLVHQLESPQSGPVAGIEIIRGWAFDARAGERANNVEFYVDGQRLTTIPCCSERADVEADFPQYPAGNTRNSGWGLTFNWGNLAEGPHAVQVVMGGTSGEVLPSSIRTVDVVKPGGFPFLDRLDLGGASAHIEGQAVVLQGAIIRDKLTGQSAAVDLRLVWSESSQSLAVGSAATSF